jgi:hypothetical protein
MIVVVGTCRLLAAAVNGKATAGDVSYQTRKTRNTEPTGRSRCRGKRGHDPTARFGCFRIAVDNRRPSEAIGQAAIVTTTTTTMTLFQRIFTMKSNGAVLLK